LNQRNGLAIATAITLAVIITAGGMSLVGSYVLCVGSDGHADLELALGACCIDDNGARDETDRSERLVDSCGVCADIGLDASPLTKGKQRLAPPRCVMVDPAGQLDASSESVLAADRGAEFGPPHLKDLKTVILLT